MARWISPVDIVDAVTNERHKLFFDIELKKRNVIALKPNSRMAKLVEKSYSFVSQPMIQKTIDGDTFFWVKITNVYDKDTIKELGQRKNVILEKVDNNLEFIGVVGKLQKEYREQTGGELKWEKNWWEELQTQSESTDKKQIEF